MNDDTVAWKLQERAKIALLSSAVVHEWLGGSNAARSENNNRLWICATPRNASGGQNFFQKTWLEQGAILEREEE